MLIGAHIQTAAGYPRTVAYAAEVGCEALQIFAKSPQRWIGKPIDPEAAAAFAEARTEAGLGILYTHSAYLINLGSRDPDIWLKSVEAYADEIVRAATLQATGVITHIGTRFDPDSLDASAARVAEAVCRALEMSGVEPGRLKLLLENTAGAGTTFGGSFEELGAIVGRLEQAGVVGSGLCIDTCHAWAYGLDVGSQAGWTHLLDQIEGCCGAGRIQVMHANDCKFPRGANKDRHEWIGDGHIGTNGFKVMMCEPRLRGVAAILEMPGEAPLKDVENIARLKRMRASCWE
jgi:deoxyribonuclease-4